ncbi:DUF3891 family protein [soil metagenome]
MIVRKLADSYLLIRQHEHGQISGQFARHWDYEISPDGPTLFAITNHDVGWIELDEEVRFNPDSGEPYSFIDYPLDAKLRAYKHGLDQIEVQDPYAAYLCSRHYSSFVEDSLETPAVEFREREAGRRARLEQRLPHDWLANAEYNFRLLQLCDDFSLFVCFNDPGENTFPWYRDGFDFMGETLHPEWRDRQTLSLSPDPFSGPFDFVVPYSRIGVDGKGSANGGFHIRVAG